MTSEILKDDEIADNKVTVSVIMSVYNEALYIYDAVMSICNQSFKDFEFIIFDDCSTDDTVKIIEQINDARIILVKNKINKGITKNLNAAIRMAKGKYIARMDGDDISTVNRMGIQVEFLDKNLDIAICGTWGISISEKGRKRYKIKTPINDADIKKRMVCTNCIVHSSVMIRREVFNKVMYDEKFRSAQDFKLWGDCWHLKFSIIPKCLILHRKNSKGISASERNNVDKRLLYISNIYSEILNKVNIHFTEEQLLIYVRMVTGLVRLNEQDDANQALEIRRKIEKLDCIDKKWLVLCWRKNVSFEYRYNDIKSSLIGVIYQIQELVKLL